MIDINLNTTIYFNTGQIILTGACAFGVFLLTSAIHHLVGKINRWWNPRIASFIFSLLTGIGAHLLFIDELEPLHILIMMGDICIIYLCAIGLNTLLGKPVYLLFEFTDIREKAVQEKEKANRQSKEIITSGENWQTRWFDSVDNRSF